MREFTAGVLEGLAYAYAMTRGSKASEKISRQILQILEAQAQDFENRSKGVA